MSNELRIATVLEKMLDGGYYTGYYFMCLDLRAARDNKVITFEEEELTKRFIYDRLKGYGALVTYLQAHNDFNLRYSIREAGPKQAEKKLFWYRQVIRELRGEITEGQASWYTPMADWIKIMFTKEVK